MENQLEDEYRNLLTGIIILILIIDTTVLFSHVSSTGLENTSQSIVPPAVEIISRPSVNQTLIPAASPKNTTPAKEKTPVPTPTPIPVRKGYVNIFYLENKNLSAPIRPFTFNLVNPPLIIDYRVIPYNITDMKYFEYKIMSTKFEETVNITRPYENAWFTITIVDKETGEIFIRDGYGKEYALQSPKHLEIRERGNYKIEVDGNSVVFNLSMEVKKEGNIP